MYLITNAKTGYLKSVTEPKMIDATHYKFMGKVLPMTGPLGEIPANIQERIEMAMTKEPEITCSNWWLNYIVFDINDRPTRGAKYDNEKENALINDDFTKVLKASLSNKHRKAA